MLAISRPYAASRYSSMSEYDTSKYIRSPIDLSRSTSNVPHELPTRWSRAARIRGGLRGTPGQRVLEFLEPLGPAAAATALADDDSGCGFRLQLRRAGHAADYWSHNGTSTRLTFDNSTDNNPKTAAERLVFTSYRDENPEIYIAGIDGSSQTRLTQSPGLNDEAAIDPTGTHIVFVSDRSGTLRLFTMDVSGAHRPRSRPARRRGFRSARRRGAPTVRRSRSPRRAWEILQVFVMPASGGEAVQLTHEAGGGSTRHGRPTAARSCSVSATGTVPSPGDVGVGRVARLRSG